ncbi:nucleoside hydrolase-like domain-containing protein [Planctomycetota bacterium]
MPGFLYETSSWGQHKWAEEHIMTNHGALGELFPLRHGGKTFIEGGGTTPWIGLTNHGLSDPEHLYWGGWSGRFSRTKHKNVLSRFGGVKKDEKDYPDYFMYEADSEGANLGSNPNL